MVYSNPGYCSCGQEIWIEALWNGREWTHRFLTPDHLEVTECPECRRELREDDLESL